MTVKPVYKTTNGLTFETMQEALLHDALSEITIYLHDYQIQGIVNLLISKFNFSPKLSLEPYENEIDRKETI